MEYCKKNFGLVSGLLSASGTIGSLLGFSMALLCSIPGMPEGFWRLGFFLGGVAGCLSYKMRKILAEMPVAAERSDEVQHSAPFLALAIVALIGMTVGTTTWIPMTYSNFYLTKVLGLPSSEGLTATLIALVAFSLFTPLWGAISDRFSRMRYMMWASLAAFPLSFLSFYGLAQGHIALGQVGFILAASCFGAPIHAVMNSLFSQKVRGRRVALLFMVGLSLGGMAPSICSLVVDMTGFQYAPALFSSLIASLSALLFYLYTRRLAVKVAAPA